MTDHPTVNAFLYFRTPTSLPILCEVCANLVWETGEPYAKPISQYSAGEFVPLIALPLEVRTAIEEALDLAGEAIPYAGIYFDEKYDLAGRYDAAYAVLRPWLDAWLEPSAAETGNGDNAQRAP